MGALRHRNGKWFIDLLIDGKRYRKVVSRSRKLAELALRDLELKAERNQLGFLQQKEISIQAFFQEYAQFSKANHRLATQARYRSVIQHFLAFMAQHEANIVLLKSLKVEHIERYKIYRKSQLVPRNGYYNDLSGARLSQKGAKAYTINFEILTLRTIFYYAIKLNYLYTNPAKGVQKLKTDDAQRRRFLTEEECRRLLTASSDEHYPILYTFMNTGMRRGELVHLEWSDIDLVQKTLIIRRKPFWSPKTGEREIPLNDGLINVLKGLSRSSNYVFCDHLGRRLDPNRVRDYLIKTAKKAGIPSLTQVHALRHSFCSQLLQKGVDLPSVQKLMGHSKIETTMIYTHQTSKHLREAISKIELSGRY